MVTRDQPVNNYVFLFFRLSENSGVFKRFIEWRIWLFVWCKLKVLFFRRDFLFLFDLNLHFDIGSQGGSDGPIFEANNASCLIVAKLFDQFFLKVARVLWKFVTFLQNIILYLWLIVNDQINCISLGFDLLRVFWMYNGFVLLSLRLILLHIPNQLIRI